VDDMGIILDSLEFKDGYKVLDVGCSTGSLLIELRYRLGDKIELVGIDRSAKRIEKAKKASKGLNIRFEKGIVENLPYEDNYFDIVLSTFLFHRLDIESKKRGIQEIKRVLKPNCKLMIIDVGKPIGLYSKFIGLFLRWFYEFKTNLHGEVINLLKENDFKIEFIENITRLVGTINIILACNVK